MNKVPLPLAWKLELVFHEKPKKAAVNVSKILAARKSMSEQNVLYAFG